MSQNYVAINVKILMVQKLTQESGRNVGIPKASRFDYQRILENNEEHLRNTCSILHEDVDFADS